MAGKMRGYPLLCGGRNLQVEPALRSAFGGIYRPQSSRWVHMETTRGNSVGGALFHSQTSQAFPLEKNLHMNHAPVCSKLAASHVLRRLGSFPHHWTSCSASSHKPFQMLPLIYASITQTILLRVEQTTPLGPDVPF